MDCLTINGKDSAPAVLGGAPINTLHTRGVIVALPAITVILTSCRFPQITNAVIQRITITVVQATSRPTTMHVEPSQPMGSHLEAKDTNN
jgi:hypothetical protein